MITTLPQRNVPAKISEWLTRYFPAEIIAIIGAMAGGLLTHYFFHNPVLTALGGTWGENIGYYGKILYSDVQARKKMDEKITFISIVKVFRNAIVEFGFAEYLDSFIIRPFAMYFFPKWTGNVVLGLFLGKISADVTFYLPTIFFYELRKKYFKD
ncbi:MAG: hypothetical protein UX04_C0002G0058 [Microgenomates group bacterium GW2011_GWF2_45_18]|nr:MAG: hypothetical protein UW18_C0001G0039 [Microgenomates group bacterium GW2011_GWF1_44_10]KKU01915.1 MAG: hypothetical protein UX04_C0002G0058 [Microgenomates group bacterium GW2011_GWF2_45_18]OGJ40237.1 MAG: hypothetical protein A2378_03375 [Candidatus Pacebacteria bacterium RIFOXYB1_FULL_44_10]HAU98770.1 hypothetical protein [Candidatus Paceibacterota bacterium]HAX01410.1 hypothetical protein [Candidatus Paceibacterota bacterium]